VSIDNPGNELKANMTANAEIVLEEFANSLIIPESAISYDAKRNPTVDLVDPEHGLGRHAGDDARRHQPGVRPGQGG